MALLSAEWRGHAGLSEGAARHSSAQLTRQLLEQRGSGLPLSEPAPFSAYRILTLQQGQGRAQRPNVLGLPTACPMAGTFTCGTARAWASIRLQAPWRSSGIVSLCGGAAPFSFFKFYGGVPDTQAARIKLDKL